MNGESSQLCEAPSLLRNCEEPKDLIEAKIRRPIGLRQVEMASRAIVCKGRFE